MILLIASIPDFKNLNNYIDKDIIKEADQKKLTPFQRLLLYDKNFDGIIKHINFTFLTDKVYLIDFTNFTNLSLSIRDDKMLISGSLSTWMFSLKTICQFNMSKDFRLQGNKAVVWFQQLGFTFKKKDLGDGTFSLSD